MSKKKQTKECDGEFAWVKDEVQNRLDEAIADINDELGVEVIDPMTAYFHIEPKVVLHRECGCDLAKVASA
jgi:hypothetical protein